MAAIHTVAPLGIPRLGFGTGTTYFKTDENAPLDNETIHGVRAALEAGFRHIDAAQMYHTEKEVGIALATALKDGIVKRDDVWVTTKLDNPNQIPERVEASLKQSLEDLQLDCVDLFLVHSPFKKSKYSECKEDVPLADTWKAMEGIHAKGLARFIGVSNFRVQDLEAILAAAKVLPVVNQIEQHPHLVQPELLEFCKKHNIIVESYAPLSSLTNDVEGSEALTEYVEKLAQEKKATPALVLLKWNVDRGNVAITTSKRPERIREYLGIEDVELSAEEIDKITELGSKTRRRFFWDTNFNDTK